MKIRGWHGGLTALSLALILVSCGPPPRYEGAYFPADCMYENRDLGLTLRFSGKWILKTDPRRMARPARAFARELRTAGADLLFSGASADGRQAVRCIVINANMGAEAYAEAIRGTNVAGVTADSGLAIIADDGDTLIRWEYSVGNYRFGEYFYQVGTYNIRLAFWTDPLTYTRFRPIYENSARSLRWFR